MKRIILLLTILIQFSFAIAQTGNQQQQSATLKNASRLFGEKDDLTSVKIIIPSGSKVTVLGSDSTYYHVKYEDTEGYIFKRQAVIDNTPEPVDSRNNISSEQKGNSSEQNTAGNLLTRETRSDTEEQQSRFSYLENKYGTSTAARINSGKIWKGMTAEMVKDSWGSPGRINRVVNGNTMKEEWTYKGTVLYFENSILNNWGPVIKQ
ncbi:MAG TPA: hypothetical protein VK213_05800 [Bacteroidales bacterium]|nr:hypothetical protein [Bacteroidales bacterium]